MSTQFHISTNDQGDKVTPTEHPANTPSTPKAGLFATLGGLLRVKGSGASILAMAIALCGLLFAAAPALAAAPEKPEALTPTEITASTATLHGLLNPGKEGEPGTFETGTYEFVYLKSATACKGTGEVKTTAGMSLGGGREEVSQALEGLSANTKYTICVVAHNNAKTESSTSTPVSFITGPPQTPETKPAGEETPTAAKLHGVLDPIGEGQPGKYVFLYRQSSSACMGEGQKTVGAGEATGAEKQAVEAEVTELLPGTEYTFCLQAQSEAGETALGTAVSFTTALLSPEVPAESVESTNETSSSVELKAKIVPGGPAKYHFEYGTSTAYEQSTPEQTLLPEGSAETPIAVSTQIDALTPGAEYHFRLVVESTAGKAQSADHTFALPGAAASTGDVNEPAGVCSPAAEASPGFRQLPDCRVYEQVTPTQKNGALIGSAFAVLRAEVAAGGSRLVAVSIQCLPGSRSCVPNRQPNEGDPYAFERATDGGWLTRALAPSASELPTDSYYSLDAEAGTALFSAPGPPLGQDNFYALSPGGTLSDVGPVGESKEDTNERIKIGSNGPEVVATADLSHVVYASENGPLWAFDETDPEDSGLYEYAVAGNAAPLLVGVEGGDGSDRLVSECGTKLPGHGETVSNGTLSENGRIVYFLVLGHSSEGGCEASLRAPVVGELWARIDGERADAHSVLVSGPAAAGCTSVECVENTNEAMAEERARRPVFEAASSSGERVVFADAQQLTDAASEGAQGEENLYESECPGFCENPAGERRLVDVSDPGEGAAQVAGGPRVQGVMAVSSDGSRVYFVAQGVLTQAPNLYGGKAQDGEDNLYLYSEGRLAFIAVLSPSGGQSKQWSGSLSVNVTPDGGFLVFTDDRALTADDTRPEEDAEGAAQVYEYDAATNTLSRVSVGQEGYADDGNAGTGNAFIAAAARGGDLTGTASLRRDPSMSEDGHRVFFESPIALVRGALNDVKVGEQSGEVFYAHNIYEWQAPATGGCTLPAGCVYLISDGKDVSGTEYGVSEYPEENAPNGLIGTDRTGSNVFFSTFDQLVPGDTDGERDYYDAHVCSEGEPCTPPAAQPAPACGEGSCQLSTTQPPATSAPASLSFAGAGNLVPSAPAVAKPAKAKTLKCKRGLVRKKVKKKEVCVRKPKKESHAKKSSHNGRAK